MSDKILILLKEKATILLAWWSVRIGLLLAAAFGGVYYANPASCLLAKWIGFKLATSVQLKILLMSLPVLSVLWLFRTFDTREQIQKAQENAEAAREGVEATREALNADTLGRYINMLFSSSLEARCVGLIRLADIKRQGKFAEEIDSATRQGIDLKRAVLEGENLSGLNLDGALLNGIKLYEVDISGASLRFAILDSSLLCNVNLAGANLRFASFAGASLRGVDLRNAYLQNAKLGDAQDVGDIKSLNGAEYNHSTQFPEGFNPKQEGMIYQEDPVRRP